MYERLARPVLFRLGHGDAETAHETTLRWLGRTAKSPAAVRALATVSGTGGGRPRTVFGVRFPNPVGLAAGMDKDGRALPAWPALGFGFVEVGTVTARAQPGNERPRLFRLPDSGAVINRMGFNNAGAAALAARLDRLGRLPVPLGISLGKSKVTPLADAVDDYVRSLRALAPYADYLAVNVSSPNTPGLRTLQDAGHLRDLLAALQAELAGAKPLLVKVAPDLTDEALGELLAVCVERGLAGVIATNTTLARTGIAPADADRAAETGGLSGRPLAERAREVVAFITRETGGALPVIGVGGIMTADDAARMVDAGASLVQIYSGLIYRGPSLVRDINRRLALRPAADTAGRRREPPPMRTAADDNRRQVGPAERNKMDSFAVRLRRALDERGPLCVGIDPHPELLSRWGLPNNPDGLARFAQIAVDALADRVAVIKPQSAFFERFGSRGIATLESTIRQLRDAGAIVLLDVKRGDIGSTAAAYASAYLDPVSPMYVDAMTASPYLGFGSLQPVIEMAGTHGGGVFVLAMTSNPEGAAVQQARGADGRTVAQQVIDEISQVNAGAEPFGAIGAVIGATVGSTDLDLTNINGPMLAPGLGAQGGTAVDLRTVFGDDLSRVIPSTSRDVLGAGPDIGALRDAAERVLDGCRRVISETR